MCVSSLGHDDPPSQAGQLVADIGKRKGSKEQMNPYA